MTDSIIEEGTPPATPDNKDALLNELRTEIDNLKVDLQARRTVEELAEEIFSRAAPRQEPELTNGNRNDPPLNGAPEGAKMVDLNAEIKKILAEERTRAAVEGNISKAKELLKQAYGADYKTTVEKAASQLGISTKFLDNLAGSTPEGLLNVLKSVAPPDSNISGAPPQSTTGIETRDGGVRKNHAYYSNLRKTDRDLYLSRNVQAEMHDEAMRQGELFYR